MANTKGYDLDTPIVKDWIRYRASEDFPFLREEIYGSHWKEIKSQETFLEAWDKSKKSRSTLIGYNQIEGFNECVKIEKERIKKRFYRVAVKGLYTLASGGKKTKKEVSEKGYRDTEETYLPNEKACMDILEVFTGYTPKQNLEHSFDIETLGEAIAYAEQKRTK